MKKKIVDVIEISIIVLIVIILTIISILAFMSSRARANDARVVSDVRQIQSALALYRHDFDAYPDAESFIAGKPLAAGENVYMGIIPEPPSSKSNCVGSYVYTYTAHTSTEELSYYTLEYCLGSETAGISGGINTATPAGIKMRDN